MGIVTLTTDFGLGDAYVGAVKGVILCIAPTTVLVDICHDVRAQDVVSGSRTLAAAWRHFPPASVHLAIIDPGVGTGRRPLAVAYAGHFFVAPDNGLLPLLWQASSQPADVTAVHLTRREFWLPEPSATFHGRDIFAPVAAHLASGRALVSLGDKIDADDLVRIAPPLVERIGDEMACTIVHVDHFGNLVTNLHATMLNHRLSAIVTLGERRIVGLKGTYGDGSPGDVVALVGSDGYVEIAVVNGNAARVLGLGEGTPVLVHDRI